MEICRQSYYLRFRSGISRHFDIEYWIVYLAAKFWWRIYLFHVIIQIQILYWRVAGPDEKIIVEFAYSISSILNLDGFFLVSIGNTVHFKQSILFFSVFESGNEWVPINGAKSFTRIALRIYIFPENRKLVSLIGFYWTSFFLKIGWGLDYYLIWFFCEIRNIFVNLWYLLLVFTFNRSNFLQKKVL